VVRTPSAAVTTGIGDWRPTEKPGQTLFLMGAPAGIYETFVPRSQFRHYTRIGEAEAVRW
jgi:hypothetical protein